MTSIHRLIKPSHPLVVVIHATAKSFELINKCFIHQGLQHRPLALDLPRWYAIHKPTIHVQSINRLRLCQEMMDATPRWLQFEQAIRNCILNHHSKSLIDLVQNCLDMEYRIRQLWFAHFPRIHIVKHPDAQIRSMTVRMWHARKQLRFVFIVSVEILFHNWKNCTQFQKLHAQIRIFNRINNQRNLKDSCKIM